MKTRITMAKRSLTPRPQPDEPCPAGAIRIVYAKKVGDRVEHQVRTVLPADAGAIRTCKPVEFAREAVPCLVAYDVEKKVTRTFVLSRVLCMDYDAYLRQQKQKSDPVARTIAWYDANAAVYAQKTRSIDVRHLYDVFLPYLPSRAKIIDLGCGCGRDAVAFARMGYHVTGIDASWAMVEQALLLTSDSRTPDGTPGFVKADFRFLTSFELYEGVWACGSLWHVPRAALGDVLSRVQRALKPGGVFYLCFKLGDGERVVGGRHYTDFTRESLRKFINENTNMNILRIWETPGPIMGGGREVFVNAICRR
jgi:SAM-dependent methyltransferase